MSSARLHPSDWSKKLGQDQQPTVYTETTEEELQRISASKGTEIACKRVAMPLFFHPAGQMMFTATWPTQMMFTATWPTSGQPQHKLYSDETVNMQVNYIPANTAQYVHVQCAQHPGLKLAAQR